MRAALRMRLAGAMGAPAGNGEDGRDRQGGLHCYAKQLLHRLQRAGELFALAGETESDVTLAMRSEVDAGHAADASISDEMLDHPPRDRRIVCGRASAARPFRIDPEERVERASGRRPGKHIACELADTAIEQITAR